MMKWAFLSPFIPTSFIGAGAIFFLLGSWGGREAAASILLLTIICVFFLGQWSEQDQRALALSVVVLLFSWSFFSAQSFLFFFIVFEGALFPIIFILFGWGGQFERLRASMWFLVYASCFSFPLFLFIIVLKSGQHAALSSLGLIFGVGAFLVKMPAYFFHLWLPKAHTEAPTIGSILLAGVLLKLGSYGVYRLLFLSEGGFPLLFILLGSLGLILSAMSCSLQSDMKALVALSSVVHMNFMLFVFGLSGLLGASSSFILMFSHGLISGVLFFFIGPLAHVFFSRSVLFLGGGLLLSSCFIFIVFCGFAGNMGVPPFLSFFSEALFISGSFKVAQVFGLSFLFALLLGCYFSVFAGAALLHGKAPLMSLKKESALLFVGLVSILLSTNFFVLSVLP